MLAVATPVENRRRGPKVRTGCFTCKIRRVKCGEEKPNCSRCTSTGRKCDGYPKPKETFQIQVFTPSEPVTKLRPAMSQISGLGDNTRYLEFYHQCAVPSLSSRFDHEFWSKTSLQMAYTEPAVRHAIIALGYLNQTEPGSLKHARSRFQGVHGNKVFLNHYNEAVRKLVSRMTDPSYSPEIGLVTCLLFVCIEFLRGNYCTAFTHMTNGLRLVREWQQQQQRIDSPFDDLACTNSTESLIQDVLLPMFQRSMLSAQLYGVPTEEHFEIFFPHPDSFIRLPFTLKEAERSSRELRNASVLFLRQTGMKHAYKIPLEEKDYEIQAQLTECHRVWFERAQMMEDSQQYTGDESIALSNLKVAHFATLTYVGCAGSVLQVPYDTYLHIFQALVRHAEIVLDALHTSSPYAARFTFEISVVAPLFHTAGRCRCPITRRKAVSLLARRPPREGLWDPEQYLLVANRLIELEERELDPETGWPPERARFYSSVVDANMDAQGGFWVMFEPSEWVGEMDETGKQKLIYERFTM
ncbi:hypothetical protein E8E11_010578 [Didymella keratinophila]|nr:hypothetical protein E8E11_010578 [Didymella keratinophila]